MAKPSSVVNLILIIGLIITHATLSTHKPTFVS